MNNPPSKREILRGIVLESIDDKLFLSNNIILDHISKSTYLLDYQAKKYYSTKSKKYPSPTSTPTQPSFLLPNIIVNIKIKKMAKSSVSKTFFQSRIVPERGTLTVTYSYCQTMFKSTPITHSYSFPYTTPSNTLLPPHLIQFISTPYLASNTLYHSPP